MDDTNKIKIQLMIEQGPPKHKEEHPLAKGPSLTQRVDEAILNVQSNMDDTFERERKEDWCFLRCLFRVLSKKSRLTEPQCVILDKIEPVIRKFAFSHKGAADIDGTDLNKTKSPEERK